MKNVLTLFPIHARNKSLKCFLLIDIVNHFFHPPAATPRAGSGKPYCAVSVGTASAFATAGGFHLPVSASDFGA